MRIDFITVEHLGLEESHLLLRRLVGVVVVAKTQVLIVTSCAPQHWCPIRIESLSRILARKLHLCLSVS